MEKNVGKQEAFVRTLVAAVTVFVAWIFVENAIARIILALLSAYIAGTAYLHSCFLNKLMGRNTFEPDSANPQLATDTNMQESASLTDKDDNANTAV